MVTLIYEHRAHQSGYQRLDELREGAWMFVEGPTSADLVDLAEKYELNAGHLSDVRDAEEMPRLVFEDEGVYLYLRHAYTNGSGERTTAPLLMVLTQANLIIITPHPLATDFNPKKSARSLRGTMLQVIEHVLDQYTTFADEINHRIIALRRSLHRHEISNQDLAYFVTLEEELNDFSTSLEPITAILQRLVLAHHFPLSQSENELLGDLVLQNQQLLGATASRLQSIDSIRQAHGTIATNNLNRSMKILTVATVLLALPNVVFGSLGMNMPIPFPNKWYSYPVVLSLTFLATIIVYAIARKKRIF